MIMSSLGGNGGLNISNKIVYCNYYYAQYQKNSVTSLTIAIPTNYINDTKFIIVDFQQVYFTYSSTYFLCIPAYTMFTKGVNSSTNVLLGLWGNTTQSTNTDYNMFVRPITYTSTSNHHTISIALQESLSISVNLICLG